MPIGQRLTVGEITVALISLELFEDGLGVLRYRISYEESMFEGGYGLRDILMPELVVRDGSGRILPFSPDGEVEIRDQPEAGELEVEVTRLVSVMFDEEAGEEVVEDSFEGPWLFRFVI